MTTDTPSSAEMIRRAKETLRLAKEDFLPKVEEDVAELGMPMGNIAASMSEAMPVEMPAETMSRVKLERAAAMEAARQTTRSRRVESSTVDHLVVARRIPTTTMGPIPPSPVSTGAVTGSGRWMGVVGNVLLAFVAVIWVLLLISLIDNPQDVGSVIGGGIVSTLVPLLFGLVLRRAGKRRATRV